jgi:glutathione S-transferase
MADKPTLYVCHGDDGGPRFHPCRKVQTALDEAGVEYEKVIGGKGNPLPFVNPPRERVIADTGQGKLPTLKLPDGTLLTHSREILGWVEQLR